MELRWRSQARGLPYPGPCTPPRGYHLYQILAADRASALTFLWCMDENKTKEPGDAEAGGGASLWLPRELWRPILSYLPRASGVVCAGSLRLATPSAPLKRCLRCKGVAYESAAVQKSHWKLHKKVCKPLDAATASKIGGMGIDVVEGLLTSQMRSAGYDCTTAALMHRLRALMDAEATDYAEVGMRLHSLARGLIFHQNWGSELLWASPGMAELLTTGDNLHSLAVQKRAAIGFSRGLPSDDCAPFLSERQQNAVRVLRAEEDARGWGQTPGSMEYSYLYFNLLVASAVQGRQTMGSANDGSGRIRIGTPGSTIKELPLRAIARVCELWTDPLARESCGDALAPGSSFATTVARTFGQPGKQLLTPSYNSRLELGPGLSRDGAVMAAIGELADGAVARQQACTLLTTIANLQAEMQIAYDNAIRTLHGAAGQHAVCDAVKASAVEKSTGEGVFSVY